MAVTCELAWQGLFAAHDAGRAVERADVLALMEAHRSALVRIGGVAEGAVELRRFDELVVSIATGLHDRGGAGS